MMFLVVIGVLTAVPTFKLLGAKDIPKTHIDSLKTKYKLDY